MNLRDRYKLYIFTDYFPYGNGEQFLDQELKIATQYFSEVVLFPRFTTVQQRPLPSGVSVSNSCTNFSKIEMLGIFLFNFGFVKQWNQFFKIFSTSNFGFYTQLKSFLSYHIESKLIMTRLKDLDQTAIYYSYWLKHAAVAIAASNRSILKIARGHGSDIYPIKYDHFLQESCLRNLDQTFTVSEAGRNYLVNKYKGIEQKVTVSHLGTTKVEREVSITQGNGLDNNHSQLHVLSCSALIPLKRVDYILEALILTAQRLPEKRVTWTHIGDGPELHKLKAIAQNAQPNLQVSLQGSIANEDLHQFYMSNKVDCFINFSTSEGIPVAIMEALSYGVPIVASDVGGNSEIVNNDVGVLIPSDSSIEDISSAIIEIVNHRARYTKENCTTWWRENFEANLNFSKFYENLIALANAKTLA